MFRKFLKDSSKFLAVLLTALLAFSPLSYADYGWTDLKNNIQNEGSITLPNSITDAPTAGNDSLGLQGATVLTIDGGGNTISANKNAGMEVNKNTTTIDNVTFKDFKREGDGGGVIEIKRGSVTITNSQFISNKSGGRGGVISFVSKEENNNDRIGQLRIENSYFADNYAMGGGAIFSEGNLTISTTTFENNTAEYVGAIAITGSDDDIVSFYNVTFSTNSSSGDNSGNEETLPVAGALFLGSESNIVIEKGKFEYNESAVDGGAIGSKNFGEEAPDFSKAKFEVKGVTFTGNVATGNGGAIDNYFYGSSEYSSTFHDDQQVKMDGNGNPVLDNGNPVYEDVSILDAPGYVSVKDSKFDNNQAGYGGAIYNHGNVDGKSEAIMKIENTDFTGNTAQTAGGAIYNEGTIKFGDNVAFSSNVVHLSGAEGTEKNDIFNIGTLIFEEGTTTVDGGITGNIPTSGGFAGTVRIAGGSIQLGKNSKLQQKNLEITEGSEFSADVSNIENQKIAISSCVQNAGMLTLTGGSVSATGGFTSNAGLTKIDGYSGSYGETVFDTYSYIQNDIDITQSTITIKGNVENNKILSAANVIQIENGGKLKTNATKLVGASNGSNNYDTTLVTNDGTLIFVDGTEDSPTINLNDISQGTTQTGNLVIEGYVENKKSITQSTITVSGSLKHTDGVITSSNIIVETGAKLTASSPITLEEGVTIINEGTTEVKNVYDPSEEENAVKTNGATIQGSGEFILTNSGFTNNDGQNKQGSIQQGTIKLVGSKFANEATLIATQTIDIDADSTFTNRDGATTQAATIINKGVFNSSGTVTATDGIQNSGTINLFSDNANDIDGIPGSDITYYGDITVQGNVKNSGDIKTKSLAIYKNASFETNVSSINVINAGAAPTISNAGVLTLTGNGENNNVITGFAEMVPGTPAAIPTYGETIFESGSTIINNASITQSTITVSGDVTNSTAGQLNVDPNQTGKEGVIAITGTGKLTSNADNLTVGNYISIANGGKLVLTGGTIDNMVNPVFSETPNSGALTIEGDVTNSNHDGVNISTLTVFSGATLTNNGDISTDYLIGSKVVSNDMLSVNLVDNNSYNLDELTGITSVYGVTFINAENQDVDMNISGKIIRQGIIYFDGDKHLRIIGGEGTNKTNIVAGKEITNRMTGDSLELVNTVLDTPKFINEPNAHVIFAEGSGVNGIIENDSGTIHILSSDFETKGEITAGTVGEHRYDYDDEDRIWYGTNNLLYIGSATTNTVGNLTSSHTIYYQNITVSSGSLTMSNGNEDGLIYRSSITVEGAGTLRANASRIITIDNSIVNYGNLIFESAVATTATNVAPAMTNENTVTGDGNLIINANVDNKVGTTITQSSITINGGYTFKANADDIKVKDSIINAGIYEVIGGTITSAIAGGTATNPTDASVIPAGTVNINTAEVTLDSAISSNTIQVSKELKLTQSANIAESALIISSGAIINTQNGSTGTITAQSITIEDNAQWTYRLDAKLSADTQTADMLSSENWYVGSGSSATIDNIRFISSDTSTAKVLIANEKINSVIDRPYIADSNRIYYISTLENDDGTYLIFRPNEVSSLPIAVSSAIPQYEFLEDEIVSEWENNNTDNFLKVNTKIIGGGYNLIGENGVEGLKTSTYTLTIENLAAFSGFNNAIKVEVSGESSGTLKATNVVFSSNTGTAGDSNTAVITNEGTVELSSVTFVNNDTVYDILNKGNLVVTGEGQTTTFDKGVYGDAAAGTTTVKSGATAEFGENATIAQENLIVEDDALLVAHLNDNISVNTFRNNGTTTFNVGDGDVNFNLNVLSDEGKGNLEFNFIGDDSVTINSGVDINQSTMAIGSNITFNNSKEITTNNLDIDGTMYNYNGSTVTTNKLAGDGELTNNGVVNLNLLNNDSYSVATLTGDGTTNISVAGISGNSVTIDVTGRTIAQTINLTGSKSLFLEGTANDGSNIIINNYLTGNSLELNSEIAQLNNNPDSSVTGGVVNVMENGAVTGQITNTNGVINFINGTDNPFVIQTGLTTNDTSIDIAYNKINIGSSTAAGSVVSSNTIAYQTITISSGSLTMQNDGVDGIISNSKVRIEENGTLTVNASSVTLASADDEIQNAGKVIFTGGENNNVISGYAGTYGETIFKEDVTVTNYANITQSTITVRGTVENTGLLLATDDSDAGAGVIAIDGTGKLTSNAEKLLAEKNIVIADGGELVLTGGTNNNNINEDNSSNIFNGTLTVTGDVTNVKYVYVSTVSVEGTATLTNNSTMETNYITGSNVENKNCLKLYLLDNEGYKLETLTGDGQLDIHNNVQASTMNISGKSLTQSSFLFYGEQELTVEGDSSTPTKLVATGIGVSNYSAAGVKFENVAIKGNFSNVWPDDKAFFEDGTSVSGLINNNGQLYIRKSNEPFVVEQGITGSSSTVATNLLYIGDAANDKAGIVVSSNTIEYQTITVSSGSLTMENDIYGIIDNSAVTVEENGELTVHASSMTNIVNKTVTNDGKVILVGNATATNNENAFVDAAGNGSKGNLKIRGNINNIEGTAITQSTVTVLRTSTLTASASDITTGTGIFNAGALVFKSTNSMTNDNLITGIGDEYGNLTIDGNLTNNRDITQYDITITSGITTNNTNNTNNADVTITANNNFVVQSSGALVNGGTVNASEEFQNFGKVENMTNATITAKFLENNGTIGSTGTITAGTIENGLGAAIYNYAGGVIESTSIINGGTIESTGTITANTITNNSGATITNFDGGSITAADIANSSGAVITTEGNIEFTNSFINEGTIISTTGTITSQTGKLIQNTSSGTIHANADTIKVEIFNTGMYDVLGGTITKNVTGATGGIVNIAKDEVTISTNAFISQNEVHVSTGLKLLDETALKTSTLIIEDGAIINTINGKTGDIDTDSVTISSNTQWTYRFDVDLQKEEGDKLINIDTVGSGSSVTLDEIQLLSDKASGASVLIADKDINAVIAGTDTLNIYTTKIKYALTVSTDSEGTKLNIEADGYGGLPIAVYEKAAQYDVTADSSTDNKDIVTRWITNYEEDGVTVSTFNFLRNNLTINGHGKILTTAAKEANEDKFLEGLKTSSYSLTISDLAEFSGFENALTVDEVEGNLRVKDVKFSSNTGNAVIASSGMVTLNNVTFDSNTVTTAVIINDNNLTLSSVTFTNNTTDSDILNNGELLITGEASTFEHGILGTGTTTIRGVAVDLSTPAASLYQSRVEISDIGDSSLTANIENTNVGLFMNNGQLVLLSSTTTELNSEINGIGDTTISGGTVTTTNSIAQTNIYLSSTSVTVGDTSTVKATTINVDEN